MGQGAPNQFGMYGGQPNMGMYNQPMYNQPMGMGGMGGMGGKGGGMGGFQQYSGGAPSFNPFGNTQSMNRGFGPFGGNMMGSRTPSWAQPQYNMQQQMFNPYSMQQQMYSQAQPTYQNGMWTGGGNNFQNQEFINRQQLATQRGNYDPKGFYLTDMVRNPNYTSTQQPSFANSGWSDAADYYKTMGEQAQKMQQLGQFDYARQRANISQLNPLGPAAQAAAQYYSGIEKTPKGNYARSGMTDAMNRLSAIGKQYEGQGTQPQGGTQMVFDKDSGTYMSQRLTDEQQRARQQKRVAESAALLASIPQLGSKPGLASST